MPLSKKNEVENLKEIITFRSKKKKKKKIECFLEGLKYNFLLGSYSISKVVHGNYMYICARIYGIMLDMAAVANKNSAEDFHPVRILFF